MADNLQHRTPARGARPCHADRALPTEPAELSREAHAVRLRNRRRPTPRQRHRMAQLSRSLSQARPRLCRPPGCLAPSRRGRLLRCLLLRPQGGKLRPSRGGAVSGPPYRSPRWVHRHPRASLRQTLAGRSAMRGALLGTTGTSSIQKPVNYVSEHLSTISPAFTPEGGEELTASPHALHSLSAPFGAERVGVRWGRPHGRQGAAE